MRRPFHSLLLKETAEIFVPVQCLLWLNALIFWASALSVGLIDGDPNPARHRDWFGWVGAFAAAVIGYMQTRREGRGDMWTFALHRPASGAQIFGAKLVTGMGAIIIAMLVPFCLAMWWPSVMDHRVVPFDRSYLLAAIADFFAALTWYAAGLYAGSRRQRPVSRGIGFALALLGTGIVAASSGFAVAIAASVTLTVVLTAAAWSDFMGGSDFDAQPLWGRAANVLSAIPAVALAVTVAAAIAGSVMPDRESEPPPPRTGPQALVTTTGRIINAPKGDDGRRGWSVLTAPELATDPRRIESTVNASYRDPRRWVTPLFVEIDGPRWYFERRQGLISIYDERTGSLKGWLGPDGYSAGPEKPARRFPGYLQAGRIFNHSRRTGLLVLSGAVYSLDELSPPKLVFTAPEGEVILQAKRGVIYGGALPGRDAPWGGYTAVTTTKRTYVVDYGSGAVQISVAHTAANANRDVSVYRASHAPGAATFLWYHPAESNPGDTTSHVLEFHQGSSTVVAEHWLEAPAYSSVVNPGTSSPTGVKSISIPAVPAIVPAAHLFATDVKAVRRVAIALLISVLSAGFAFWLCRRHAFSRERTITWTALSALVGPIALVVMWLFFERPTYEGCLTCGKARVVSADRCRHCHSVVVGRAHSPPAFVTWRYTGAAPTPTTRFKAR